MENWGDSYYVDRNLMKLGKQVCLDKETNYNMINMWFIDKCDCGGTFRRTFDQQVKSLMVNVLIFLAGNLYQWCARACGGKLPAYQPSRILNNGWAYKPGNEYTYQLRYGDYEYRV